MSDYLQCLRRMASRPDSWHPATIAALRAGAEALERQQSYPYLVYSGSEKYDLGPKHVSAMCESQAQAEALIRGMWPGTGYWELDAPTEAPRG